MSADLPGSVQLWSTESQIGQVCCNKLLPTEQVNKAGRKLYDFSTFGCLDDHCQRFFYITELQHRSLVIVLHDMASRSFETMTAIEALADLYGSSSKDG